MAAEPLEWISAESTGLTSICQVDEFIWGHRYLWPEGSDHGKFNFIRLLDKHTTATQFQAIVDEQEPVFRECEKTLSIKISDSIFSTPPDFLTGYQVAGTPLISILIEHRYLPGIEARKSVTIRECNDQNTIETFIEVNASGREWPLDHAVYEMIRRSFSKRTQVTKYYLMYVDEQPACTVKTESFGDKYNLNFLATHKDFQRRGLMNYMNLWIARDLGKDFYVQVNSDEPSYLYYSTLNGASIVNTEVKYEKKS